MLVGQDDGIRAGTTPATLARLRPVFKEGGSTTAGNSSQVGRAPACTAPIVASIMTVDSLRNACGSP